MLLKMQRSLGLRRIESQKMRGITNDKVDHAKKPTVKFTSENRVKKSKGVVCY